MKRLRSLALVISILLLLPARARCSEVLYGGNGGHSNADSINDGSLVILDQGNAGLSVVGHPAGIARLTGIAFDPSGALYASTMDAGGFPPPLPIPLTSFLVRLDPDTGLLLSTIGPILDGAGGPQISISDIAFQPGTGVLFGIRSFNDRRNRQGGLYTIDKATAVATLVTNTNGYFATIAFSPSGTLYEATALLGPDGPVSPFLKTINPANGAVLTSVATASWFGALAVRPSDGVLFGGTGDEHEIFRISPTNGSQVLVGDTGQNFVGGLAFRVQSSPSPCVPDAKTLCLSGGRFQVRADFRTPDGSSGSATAVGLTPDTGYLWFFNPENIEMVIKVLNGCGLNARFWAFAAGLTNVEVTLTVTDTQNGRVKTYLNPLNTAFVPIQDTSAFSTCP